MELREILETDKTEILKIYNEYINAESIKGIDTFEGIRNFEHLENMDFEKWFPCQKNFQHKQHIWLWKIVRL